MTETRPPTKLRRPTTSSISRSEFSYTTRHSAFIEFVLENAPIHVVLLVQFLVPRAEKVKGLFFDQKQRLSHAGYEKEKQPLALFAFGWRGCDQLWSVILAQTTLTI